MATSNWTSYIEATTVALLAPDDIVVASQVSESYISKELLPFNVYVESLNSSPVLYNTDYGSGSTLVTVTIEPYVWSVNSLEVAAHISSPVISQDTYVLSPESIVVASHATLTTVFEPPVVEVGVSPGYPRIDDIPAIVDLDFEFDVLVILDPITANTAALDAQQVPSVSFTGLNSSANTVSISDGANNVRIDT